MASFKSPVQVPRWPSAQGTHPVVISVALVLSVVSKMLDADGSAFEVFRLIDGLATGGELRGGRI